MAKGHEVDSDFIKAIPYLEDRLPEADYETISEIAGLMAKGILEQAFCTRDRDLFKEALRELQDGYAAYLIERGERGLAEKVKNFNYSEKNITDLMLAYLEEDEPVETVESPKRVEENENG